MTVTTEPMHIAIAHIRSDRGCVETAICYYTAKHGDRRAHVTARRAVTKLAAKERSK